MQFPHREAPCAPCSADLFQLYSASLAAALNHGLKAPGTSEEGRDRCAEGRFGFHRTRRGKSKSCCEESGRLPAYAAHIAARRCCLLAASVRHSPLHCSACRTGWRLPLRAPWSWPLCWWSAACPRQCSRWQVGTHAGSCNVCGAAISGGQVSLQLAPSAVCAARASQLPSAPFRRSTRRPVWRGVRRTGAGGAADAHGRGAGLHHRASHSWRQRGSGGGGGCSSGSGRSSSWAAGECGGAASCRGRGAGGTGGSSGGSGAGRGGRGQRAVQLPNHIRGVSK